MARTLQELSALGSRAGAVELRLDLLEEPIDLAGVFAARRCPVIVTLRPVEQGGRSESPPDERFRMLLKAAELGAEYVDLEWDAARGDRLAAVRDAGAAVIISRHDFSGIPEGFDSTWVSRMEESGGDIIKVVGLARAPEESLSAIRALRHASGPTIAIAMGAAGAASRILALRERRCFLTFASLNEGEGTAPGQISIDAMRNVFRCQQISQATRVFALLSQKGDAAWIVKINRRLAEAGRDAVAVPISRSPDPKETIQAFRELPVDGWHIHGSSEQHEAMGVADRLDATAKAKGKVNSLTLREAELWGSWVENTDEQMALWQAA